MVDVTFDCFLDAGGKDPDAHSPSLRRFHKLLWSKPLPSGELFDLDISGPKPFLVYNNSEESSLTSDSITHSYRTRPTIRPLIDLLPSPLREYASAPPWRIAECTLFPGKRIEGKNTINGARGMNSKIDDCFDLTLECIRRHYDGEESPLMEVLNRYGYFFSFFDNFEGYVDFFLLQDLVSEDYGEIKFYLPFQNFEGKPLPQDLTSYAAYLEGMTTFTKARSQRITMWCEENLPS